MRDKARMDLVFVLVLFGISSVSTEYVFIHPFVLEAGLESEACLILKDLSYPPEVDTQSPYKLDVVLHYHHLGQHEEFIHVLAMQGQGPNLHTCEKVTVPALEGRFNLSAIAHAQFELETGEWKTVKLFEDSTQQVTVFRPSIISLIQTDKPQYKPGDTVKIRALSLDPNFYVQLDFEKFSVESPDGLLMAQWTTDKDLGSDAASGLFNFEMALSAEPELGTWVIKGQGKEGKRTSQTFRVEEYVLPKYEVTITYPKYLSVTTKRVSGTVCAKYTYGKPVKGDLHLNVCYRSYSYGWRSSEAVQGRPCVDVLAKIDGCYEYNIPAADLELGNNNYSLYGNLVVNASVTEDGTGVILTEEVHGSHISDQPITLRLEDDSDNYFKPGFPYRGRVIVKYPDGTAASGEEIEVVASGNFYWGGIRQFGEERTTVQKKTFFSDDDGVVHFVIKELSSGGGCQIKARAVQYANDVYEPLYSYWYYPREPTARASLTQWTSPSNSYLYIPDMDDTVPCDTPLSLDVYYTSPPGTTYEFTYMVQSLSNLVTVETQTNTFDGTVDFEFTSTDPEQVLEVPPPQIPEISISGELQVGFGGELLLRCTASGAEYPPDSVDWFKDGVKIVGGAGDVPMYVYERVSIEDRTLTSTLSKPSSEFNDAGTYVCRSDLLVTSVSVDILEGTTLPPLPEPVDEPILFAEVARPLGGGRKRRATDTGSNRIAKTKMTFHPSQFNGKLGSEANVLVFYVREDKEIVSTNVKLNFQTCFENKASLSFGDMESVRPGSDVTMEVGASPGSSCFVGMVDKSVNLLGGYNQLTPDKLFERVQRDGTPRVWLSFWEEDRKYCDKTAPPPPPPPGPGEGMPDYYHHPSARPVGVDAIQPFRDAKMWIVTDGILQTRKCERPKHYYTYFRSGPGQPMPMASMDNQVMQSGREMVPESATVVTTPPPKIRSYFPETWLWDIVQVGESGTYSDNITVPDTITEWVGNSLCVHQTDGVVVTEMKGVTVFQPFFVSLTLPYSVIRGETIPIVATVFNYMKDCLTMRVSLEETAGYQLEIGASTKTLCVCGGDSNTAKFHITPTMIGDLELVVTAVSIEDTGVCTNVVLSSEGIGVSDGVERQLRVEAEGIMVEETDSSFQCVGEGEENSFFVNMSLPSDIVPDSERATLAVVGDVMGPTLSNLDNLLRMPYGCGEQNMASWAPNIYVLQYLTETGQVTDDIVKKAELYMRTGYQRQQKYRHSDNSYSAFGANMYNNNTGSLWLTAFVVKSMAQSVPFIAIDGKVMGDSVRFIQDLQQVSDGCFPEWGKVFSSYMTGGLQGGYNKEGLTAFVLIALLEAQGMSGSDLELDVWQHSNTTDLAEKCLDVDYSSLDTYTLAVTAYALTLTTSGNPRTDDVITELKSRAVMSGSTMYWARVKVEKEKPTGYWYRYSSAEIEMTAYAMMALMNYDSNNMDTAAVLPIIRWLSKQRNPYGGFSSTQDTVIALQALSMFASRTYTSEQGEVTVHVTQGGEQYDQFKVTNDNKLLYHSVPVLPKRGDVEFKLSGTGCALLQVAMRYNIYKDIDAGPAFKVRVRVARSQTDPNDCAKRALRVCVKYALKGISNMAIVKVKAPTGWEPIQSSLDELKRDEKIERFEIENDLVNMYFNEFTKAATCVVFEVQQSIVLSPKSALVTVYDYYETKHSVTASYGIKTTCGTKEEIPLNNEGLDCNRMQCRSKTVPVKVTCPRCPVKALTEEEVIELTCASQAIYKGWVARKGIYPMKFERELRNKKASSVTDFITYDLVKDCDCPILTGSETRALIFLTNSKRYEKGAVFLSDEVVFMKWSRSVQSSIRRVAAKGKLCEKLQRRKRKAEKRRQRQLARRRMSRRRHSV